MINTTNLILSLALFDAFVFGYLHEQLRLFSKSLFYAYTLKSGKIIYPFYRAIEWSLNGYALFYAYEHFRWFQFTAMVIAFLIMTKDVLFYIYLGQVKKTVEFEIQGKKTDWLFYGIGYFLFKDYFYVNKFYLIGLLGLIINIIANSFS